MNTKRLFVGDIYYNEGLDIEGYKTTLIEKDALLVKFGNRFIKAHMLKDKKDLLSFYTILKYFPIKANYELNEYFFTTNSRTKGIPFVNSKSLKKYTYKDENITFDKFLSISMLFDMEKEEVLKLK